MGTGRQLAAGAAALAAALFAPVDFSNLKPQEAEANHFHRHAHTSISISACFPGPCGFGVPFGFVQPFPVYYPVYERVREVPVYQQPPAQAQVVQPFEQQLAKERLIGRYEIQTESLAAEIRKKDERIRELQQRLAAQAPAAPPSIGKEYGKADVERAVREAVEQTKKEYTGQLGEMRKVLDELKGTNQELLKQYVGLQKQFGETQKQLGETQRQLAEQKPFWEKLLKPKEAVAAPAPERKATLKKTYSRACIEQYDVVAVQIAEAYVEAAGLNLVPFDKGKNRLALRNPEGREVFTLVLPKARSMAYETLYNQVSDGLMKSGFFPADTPQRIEIKPAPYLHECK